MATKPIAKTIKAIEYWMMGVEAAVSSQASYTSYSSSETMPILTSLRTVARSSSLQHGSLELVVGATELLLQVTGGLSGPKVSSLLAEVLEGVLSGFLSLFSESPGYSYRKLNSKVLELLAQCGEQETGTQTELLAGTSGPLLYTVTNTNLPGWLRSSWLKATNSLMVGRGRKAARKRLWLELGARMEGVLDYLYVCGDYDVQASVVEFLLRLIPKEGKDELAKKWFQGSAEAPALFLKIRDFEVDCKKFLLAVNSSMARKLVFSLPVLRCKLRSQEIFKPPGENYPTFWTDFNMGSSSISLYCVREKDVEEGMSMELVVIPQELVVGVSLACPAGSLEAVLLSFTLDQGYINNTAEMEFPGACSGQLHSLLAQLFGSRFRKVETVSDEHRDGARCLVVPGPQANSQSLEEATSIPPSEDSSSSQQNSGLAALDGVSQRAALAGSNSAAGGVTQASARLGCRVVDSLIKKEELMPRKTEGKVEKRERKRQTKLLNRAMCKSRSSTDEDDPKVEMEKLATSEVASQGTLEPKTELCPICSETFLDLMTLETHAWVCDGTQAELKMTNKTLLASLPGGSQEVGAFFEDDHKLDAMRSWKFEYITKKIEAKEKDLECPVCLEVASVPIFKCSEDHLICSICRPKMSECPECRVRYRGEPRRHRFAEKAAEELEELWRERDEVLAD